MSSVLSLKIYVKRYLQKQKKLAFTYLNILFEYLGLVKIVYKINKIMEKYILTLLSLAFLTSCWAQENITNSVTDLQNSTTIAQAETISVSSSIVPISSIINTIGWDFVDVNTVIPTGVSPHWFDLSPKDLIALEESDITFVIGLEQIDGFLDKVLADKKHVELAEWIELLEVEAHDHSEHEGEEHEEGEHNDDGDEHEGEEHHDDEDGHSDEHKDEDNHEEDEHQDDEGEHGDEHSVDAHVWLGKDNIIEISKKVRDELTSILPEQAEYFNENAKTFELELENIYNNFAIQNTWKSPNEFIVFHDAYNYMMESVWIDTNLKVPFSENVLHETSTAHLAELIEEIELHGLKYVFTEPQFSDTNIKNFASEYGLTLATLDPLGNDDSAAWYLKNMKTNLDNISLIYE